MSTTKSVQVQPEMGDSWHKRNVGGQSQALTLADWATVRMPWGHLIAPRRVKQGRRRPQMCLQPRDRPTEIRLTDG